ncbi:MAG TPA: hypothetical protein VI522_07490, partial [Gammaproteobacteria bacterium]|nr:hypothetical protein [Gammaproteobacteria bacterium]
AGIADERQTYVTMLNALDRSYATLDYTNFVHILSAIGSNLLTTSTKLQAGESKDQLNEALAFFYNVQPILNKNTPAAALEALSNYLSGEIFTALETRPDKTKPLKNLVFDCTSVLRNIQQCFPQEAATQAMLEIVNPVLRQISNIKNLCKGKDFNKSALLVAWDKLITDLALARTELGYLLEPTREQSNSKKRSSKTATKRSANQQADAHSQLLMLDAFRLVLDAYKTAIDEHNPAAEVELEGAKVENLAALDAQLQLPGWQAFKEAFNDNDGYKMQVALMCLADASRGVETSFTEGSPPKYTRRPLSLLTANPLQAAQFDALARTLSLTRVVAHVFTTDQLGVKDIDALYHQLTLDIFNLHNEGGIRQREIKFHNELYLLLEANGYAEDVTSVHDAAELLQHYRNLAGLLDPPPIIETVVKDNERNITHTETYTPITRKTEAQERALNQYRDSVAYQSMQAALGVKCPKALQRATNAFIN